MKAFEKLVSLAHHFQMKLSASLRNDSRGTPGELLNFLSPEEKEELKTLTSEDISLEKIPRDHLLYITGSYAENSARNFTPLK